MDFTTILDIYYISGFTTNLDIYISGFHYKSGYLLHFLV